MLLCDSATVYMYIMLTYDEQINFTQLGKSKRNLELLVFQVKVSHSLFC